jgi:hypothetical protein
MSLGLERRRRLCREVEVGEYDGKEEVCRWTLAYLSAEFLSTNVGASSA